MVDKVEELTMTEAEFQSRFGNDPTGDRWVAAGKPALWVISETKEVVGVKFEVHVDRGYGHLKLLRNGIEVGSGKYTIITRKSEVPEDIVVLDKDYYCVNQYMFVPLSLV